MRLSFRLFLLLLLCLPPCTVCAQEDTWGTDVSVEMTKDLSKQAGLELDAELRTRDGVETLDRLEGGLSAYCKPWPWLKLSGGYIFIYDHDERLSHYDEDDRDVKKGLAQVGDPKNLRDYWIVRHRLHADATLTHKWGPWRLSLRERWQYTYRMEKVVKGRYNYLYDRSDQAEHDKHSRADDDQLAASPQALDDGDGVARGVVVVLLLLDVLFHIIALSWQGLRSRCRGR